LECILNLVDPHFDQGHTDKYRLSILLRPDGFSFSVLDTRLRTFMALTDCSVVDSPNGAPPKNELLCDAFRMQFEAFPLLRMRYKKVDLVYASSRTSLVPEVLFRPENVSAYFRFNHSPDVTEIIKDEQVSGTDIRVLYALPSCLEKLTAGWFPGAVTGCSASTLISSLLRDNAHIPDRQVFVNLWEDYLDIAVIQGRQLVFYNTFRKKAAEDMVYYVVFVLEQLGFIPSEEKVTLMGAIDKDSDGYNLLNKYIDRLYFAGIGPEMGFSPAFAGVLVHKYYTLFNLPLCE